MTDEEIFSGIRKILVEALRKDPSIINPESRIFMDLGAESLDLLDIRFRMERMFGFKIAQDEIGKSAGAGLTPQQIRELFCVEHLVAFAKKRLAEQGQHP